MMTNGTKKFRGPNWSHEETLVLAELKKEAFLSKKEGCIVWIQIAQTISSRFPDKKRSHDQCRRRWETLRKTYKHIEEYCLETGAEHSNLDQGELSSMKLDTAYRKDWYDIVKQVYSERKRTEKGDYDLIAVKRSKRSDTCSSPSSVLREPRQGINSLYVTSLVSVCEPVITTLDADHERSTTGYGQISTQPSLEVEKLSPEEEILKLKIEKDALILELAQLRQHIQVTQQEQMLEPTYQVVQNFSAECRIPVIEPLQDAGLDLGEATVERSSEATEQDGIGAESMVSRSRSLLSEFPSDGQRLAAMNLTENKRGDQKHVEDNFWDVLEDCFLDLSNFSPASWTADGTSISLGIFLYRRSQLLYLSRSSTGEVLFGKEQGGSGESGGGRAAARELRAKDMKTLASAASK